MITPSHAWQPMLGRTAPILSALGLALTLTNGSALAVQPVADVMVMPPEREEIASPSGGYVLEMRLRESANVHAPRTTATLFRVVASTRSVVWTRELPHRPRPRLFAVGDQGQVVLLDEWLNVRSDLAVMVIDATNTVQAQYDLEAVRAVLGVPANSLAPLARYGVWIQALPVLNAQGDALEVAAANRTLVIDLNDGALSAR